MSNGNEPTRLLVPIHIDGLVVGTSFPSDKIFQWTNLAPNFAKLRGSYLFGAELGGDSGSNGNPFEKAADLQPGIHLHFRLPRALTHGSQSGAEKNFLSADSESLAGAALRRQTAQQMASYPARPGSSGAMVSQPTL
jgi:hypothetical protein